MTTKTRPTHVLLHHHWYTEEWEEWLVAVRTIKGVMGPAVIGGSKDGHRGRVDVAGYDTLREIRESPAEVEALMKGEEL